MASMLITGSESPARQREEASMKGPISIPRFFYSNKFFGRFQTTKRRRSKALPKRQKFFIEPLENRLLLSVGLIGIPNWTDQGPAPIQDAQVVVPPSNFATGAVESVA